METNWHEDLVPEMPVGGAERIDIVPDTQNEETILPDNVVPVVMPDPIIETNKERNLPDNVVPDVMPALLTHSSEETNMPEGVMPVDMPASSNMSPLDDSSSMPPPDIPSSSQIPGVNLLPPTPNTSQEAATSRPTTLLEVPEPTPTLPDNKPSRSRSRSCSPAVDPTELRRSPRLTSPAPGSKRPASDPLEEPATKKLKEQ